MKPSILAEELHPPDCFVCGPDNPCSLRAESRFDTEKGEVIFTHHFKGHETGAPGKTRLVHGGALAALLDEAQGVLAHHIGHIVMTDQLHMKYHKATPIANAVKIHAWVTTVRKRRLYTRATIENLDGDLLVSSSGRWYLMPERLLAKMSGQDGSLMGFSSELLEANKARAKKIRKKRKAQARVNGIT